jgi:hypothetical protein
MIPARFAGDRMKRFVEGTDRGQATLFPEYLEDWIYEDNPVRAIDAFVDKLGLAELGFEGMEPRPHHSSGIDVPMKRQAFPLPIPRCRGQP